jgi:glutamate synthase domain-containing protein 2
MQKQRIAEWSALADRAPTHALVGNVDLVIIRYGDEVSVLYGRCLHRGALLADGSIQGENLICGVHQWDFRFRTGISEYNNAERLHKFSAWVEDGAVWVDADEIAEWERHNPQPFDREAYQGTYQDVHGTPEEPHTKTIQGLAARGLKGAHGPVAAMGVPGPELPRWDSIQFVTAQLATPPQLDDVDVGSDVTIGPAAKKPLRLEIPIFVSDMSFGALSEEGKVALARGAELAGTAIASGEGGMLQEEQAESSRYLYELASARFGFSMDKLQKVQAMHFKGGQAAKTGTGGHLPGEKVKGKIAEVRGLEEGKSAVSPARFPDWTRPSDFRAFAKEVREATGGIPIGFKLSAQHIEQDIDAALEIGVDYIILDGRGGATGAAPLIFRNNISVPTIPALARARRHLDAAGAEQVTLIITGGLRTPADFAKALALGADGVPCGPATPTTVPWESPRRSHTCGRGSPYRLEPSGSRAS